MGREVRKVPANWAHPKTEDGRYIPLFESGYTKRAAEWDAEWLHWQTNPKHPMRYTEYAGPRPSPDDYMPDWPESERTHYMMYEDTSEGTPISPAFETPEELARWLVDNNASAFGYQGASYEAWLNIARGSWAPSGVFTPSTGLISGVEASLNLSGN